ncbi:MAG: hypothetical protein ACT4P7_11645, partial [Gemmatimonadaceae bacterium]
MGLKILGEGQTPQEAQQAERDFLDRLRRCSGLDLKFGANGVVTEGTTAGQPATGSAPVAEAIRDMIASGKQLVIRVRKKPRRGDPIIDGYCLRRVILDHLDAFPETPPAAHKSATTRCELLAHVLVEYASALRNGQIECEEGFERNHRAGIGAQKRHRAESGQGGAPPHNNRGVQRGGRTGVIFEHCDGSTTVAEQDPETGGLSVDHTPPRRKKDVKKLSKAPKSPKQLEELFASHPYVFAGTVEDMGPPPPAWTNFALAHQSVSYAGIEWLKGDGPEVSVATVHHLCMEGTLTAKRGRPGLDARLFAPGRRLLVFARLATDP